MPDLFDEIAAAISETYPGTYGPTGWRIVFGEASEDGLEALRAAIATWIATETHAPTPADIRTLLEGENKTPPWEAACARLWDAAFPSGDPDREPDWSDPALSQAVSAVGGWRSICETWRAADAPTNRAQFREAYKAAWQARREGRRREEAAKIAGPEDRSGVEGPAALDRLLGQRANLGHYLDRLLGGAL